MIKITDSLKKALAADRRFIKDISKQHKDTDGDGMIDAVDCDPFDKNKQGKFHDIIKKAKEGIVSKIQKIREENKRDRLIKEKVRQKIAQGDIKKVSDVDKQYTFGSKGGTFAKKQIRHKLIEEAREDAIFKARKRAIVEQAKQRVKARFGTGAVKQVDPFFNNIGSIGVIEPIKQKAKRRMVKKHIKSKAKKKIRKRKSQPKKETFNQLVMRL